MRVGEVAELWVYPVKSMRGRQVMQVALEAEGIRGDRRFAFASSNAPAGKPLLSSRERAAMLLYKPENAALVITPNGDKVPLMSDSLLQDLSRGTGDEGSSFRLQASPQRPLTDVRPVSIVSSATLQALSNEMFQAVDPQRFRSNIVLRLDNAIPFAEDAWSGRVLRFGEEEVAAELLLRERIPRCRMVSLDPETAAPNNAILRHLTRAHQGRLGVYATVLHAGALAVRQSVYLV